jgi:hypothetical protein
MTNATPRPPHAVAPDAPVVQEPAAPLAESGTHHGCRWTKSAVWNSPGGSMPRALRGLTTRRWTIPLSRCARRGPLEPETPPGTPSVPRNDNRWSRNL